MQQAALFRRERQIGLVVSFMWFCCFVVRLRKSARSAGDIGFILCGLIEYSHVNILPQIAQMTQRNAAGCIITQRKTVCLRLRLFCCFGVLSA